jgi:hypothetical protein
MVIDAKFHLIGLERLAVRLLRLLKRMTGGRLPALAPSSPQETG